MLYFNLLFNLLFWSFYLGPNSVYKEQNIWDKLLFSYEIGQYGKILISIFQQFFIGIKKICILAERVGASL